MTKKVKLTAKQLEILTSIQKQKQELHKNLATLNEYENIVVSLVMESGSITGPSESVTIEEEYLVFSMPESKEKVNKK